MNARSAPPLPFTPQYGRIRQGRSTVNEMHLRKDESLDELAGTGNVAQFVSFVPSPAGPQQAYSRVTGFEPNSEFATPEKAVTSLLAASADGSVNVRSYTPESPRSREFVYGLTNVAEILATIERLSAEGLHTIANETVDVNDGGVSGVAQSGIIEFAPDDTPRCVEKPGVASLPLELGLAMLKTVYGFEPELGPARGRVEFSIHPKPRGWKQTHTLLWEREEDGGPVAEASMTWPNRFSRHIGDKAYGLLLGHLTGQSVPETLCISRRVAPFRFGKSTSSVETWIRTAPMQQEPGKFTTHRGWLDPFQLLAKEDPEGTRIASVLAQQGVEARYSGASIVDRYGELIIEGVSGEGDQFMLGNRTAEILPQAIERDVRELHRRLSKDFGAARTEWVHDGQQAWLVQLHKGATDSDAAVLVPGEPDRWVGFEVRRGLEELRELLQTLDQGSGVRLVGQVGMTSHFADLVRKSGVPTRVIAA